MITKKAEPPTDTETMAVMVIDTVPLPEKEKKYNQQSKKLNPSM